MSDFIVSARKYRPATFASVVGQKHITSTLKNAIERGQLAHAYLFCGPRGVGKTTCARIFAKAINCLNPNGSEACNECESCRSFNEGRSLNIHELDAASNNSVEDIRTLIEQVRIIPQVGRYSVFTSGKIVGYFAFRTLESGRVVDLVTKSMRSLSDVVVRTPCSCSFMISAIRTLCASISFS